MNEPIILNLPYPISVNRYYRKFRNLMMISKEGRQYKKTVKGLYHDLAPSEGDFKLIIFIHPKQKKNGECFKRTVDADNPLKCIFDSLIGLLYIDDVQVKDYRVRYGLPKKDGGVTIFCVEQTSTPSDINDPAQYKEILDNLIY